MTESCAKPGLVIGQKGHKNEANVFSSAESSEYTNISRVITSTFQIYLRGGIYFQICKVHEMLDQGQAQR